MTYLKRQERGFEAASNIHAAIDSLNLLKLKKLSLMDREGEEKEIFYSEYKEMSEKIAAMKNELVKIGQKIMDEVC